MTPYVSFSFSICHNCVLLHLLVLSHFSKYQLAREDSCHIRLHEVRAVRRRAHKFLETVLRFCFVFAYVMVYWVAATRIDISHRGMSVPIFYYISILSRSPNENVCRVQRETISLAASRPLVSLFLRLAFA